jgi:hypothetical protein
VIKQGVGLVDVVVDVTNVKEVTPSKSGPKILNACAEHVKDWSAITNIRTIILVTAKFISVKLK